MCGRISDPLDLPTAFLLADGIFGGCDLEEAPFMQYLFLVKRIGVSMAPLSDNAHRVRYNKHPLNIFFVRGLRVSLATDEPLFLHMTTEALAEEYAIAAQMWKFSIVDLSELARNSVLNSGLSVEQKKQFLGEFYQRLGVAGNEAHKTNVPSIRIQFREDVIESEARFIRDVNTLAANPFLRPHHAHHQSRNGSVAMSPRGDEAPSYHTRPLIRRSASQSDMELHSHYLNSLILWISSALFELFKGVNLNEVRSRDTTTLEIIAESITV